MAFQCLKQISTFFLRIVGNQHKLLNVQHRILYSLISLIVIIINLAQNGDEHNGYQHILLYIGLIFASIQLINPMRNTLQIQIGDILYLLQYINLIVIIGKKYQLYFCLTLFCQRIPVFQLIVILAELLNIEKEHDLIDHILILFTGIFILLKSYFDCQQSQVNEQQQKYEIITHLSNNIKSGILLYQVYHQLQQVQQINQEKQSELDKKICELKVLCHSDNNEMIALNPITNKQQQEQQQQTKLKYDNLSSFLHFYIQNEDIKDKYNLIYVKDDQSKSKYMIQVSEDEFQNKSYLIVTYTLFPQLLIQREVKQQIEIYEKQIISQLNHKLKTPLSAAIGYLTAALNDETVEQTIQQKYIVPSLTNCQFQLYLVQDILDFLASEYCSLSLGSVSTQDVVQIAKQVMQIIKIPCELKQIELTMTINKQPLLQSQQPINISTDENKLSRILMNLLHNAYRFTKQNGKVNLDIEKRGDQVYFSILDTGKDSEIDLGCASEYNQSLYFNQSLAQNQEQKLGIGLFISNKQVQQLNSQNQPLIINISEGGATVDFFIDNIVDDQASRINCGSARNIQRFQKQISYKNQIKSKLSQLPSVKQKSGFQDLNSSGDEIKSLCFEQEAILTSPNALETSILQKSQFPYMPKAKPIQQISKSAQHKSLVNLNSGLIMQAHRMSIPDKILRYSINYKDHKDLVIIVDDEPFNHISLSMLLKKLGYSNIRSYYNGMELLDDFPNIKEQVFVVFMDIDMPVLNGIMTTKQILTQQMNGTMQLFPIIGFTAHQDEHTIEQCVDAGMMTVLTKPMFLQSLQQTLSMVRDLYEQNQQHGGDVALQVKD